MAQIGFIAETENISAAGERDTNVFLPQKVAPRRSVVQIFFESRNMTLSYYNDQFDLHRGDIVYVDGKLEGQRGRVTEVNYTFKIKVSDYKKVIAMADTTVHGQFFLAGSHFVTFDRAVLPGHKALSWFKAPVSEEEEVVSGSGDDTVFCLDDLKGMKISAAAAERGHGYYMENRVRYVCLDGSKGYAIVEGSEAHEVEFEYVDGEVRGLLCSCFCGGACKHEFAAMLQLKETLEKIEEQYGEQYAKSGYFASMDRGTLLSVVFDGKEGGSVTL